MGKETHTLKKLWRSSFFSIPWDRSLAERNNFYLEKIIGTQWSIFCDRGCALRLVVTFWLVETFL